MTLMAGRKYIVCLPSTRLHSFSEENGFHMVTQPLVALLGQGALLIFIMAVLVFPYQNKWKMARHLHNLVVRKYFPSTLLVYYTFCLLDERSSWYNVYVIFLGIDCAS